MHLCNKCVQCFQGLNIALSYAGIIGRNIGTILYFYINYVTTNHILRNSNFMPCAS